MTVTLSAPMPVRKSRTLDAGQSIGAAQKDVARELAAKLASARPVQYVGVLLVLAALAMFYPPIRVVTMSATLQVVTGATGVALIFAPMILIGHEAELIFGALALVAVWFFVHRHAHTQGQLAALTSTVAADAKKAVAATESFFGVTRVSAPVAPASAAAAAPLSPPVNPTGPVPQQA